VHARPRCSEEAPVLEGDAGQRVACHFWREIAVPAVLPGPSVVSPARARLDRLQSAFVTPAPAA
jgi:hypothetical protein